ncbi:hypothetical protein PLICRDRAFT_36321 [Plicaturopsis crispa FD-325 SS-3]|nr:hypothetical protein PLICRDRAFT_36321 [Plicaturopsis crispa FD-325 SS-3]
MGTLRLSVRGFRALIWTPHTFVFLSVSGMHEARACPLFRSRSKQPDFPWSRQGLHYRLRHCEKRTCSSRSKR